MTWSVNFRAVKKADARQVASDASDENIANGYQSEQQKALVLAAVDAAIGTHINGYVSGHNGPVGCSLTMSLTCYSEPEVESDDEPGDGDSAAA